MKKILLIIGVVALIFIMREASSQPPFGSGGQGGPGGPGGPNGPGGAMLSPQDMETVKKGIEERTDAANFEKRASFAMMWVRSIAASGKMDDVMRIAPPGTIMKLKNDAGRDPAAAYEAMDRLLADLKKIDPTVSAQASPMPNRQMPPNGAPPQMPPPQQGLPPRQDAMTNGKALSNIESIIVNPTSKAELWTKVYYPAERSGRLPAVIFMPGALGYGSSPVNEKEAQIIAQGGFVVGIIDPDGRGKSKGSEDWNGFIQQDGFAAFINHVASLEMVDKNNVGVVTRSYGIALGAGALSRHKTPVKYLIDVEGPADRFYITLNNTSFVLPLFNNHTTADAKWWSEREPVRWIRSLKIKYLRLQNERDHTQSANDHAIDLVNAATNASFGGTGQAVWTRVNGSENEPNRSYSNASPPRWLPGKGMVMPDELLKYIREMAAS
ncbi:MAG: hypothetical protein HYV24_10040 [Deltaproteobacteria bacterium]|nr:hypothetical protein [Deltaproteobacteria bacterium]